MERKKRRKESNLISIKHFEESNPHYIENEAFSLT
jgi:hypothetical protein